MRSTKKWYEDSKFWTTFSPFLFSEKQLSIAEEEVNQMVTLLKVKPGAHILDLCCGPGRHTVKLAQRGYQVTGVDNTKEFLKEAKLHAKKEKLKIEFVKEDMRKFRRVNSFDGAINMFTAFGYFENPKDDKRVLRNLYLSLRKGARLVMDLMGKEVLARKFLSRNWDILEDGTIHLQERKLSQNWSWIENRWILLKGNKRKDFYLAHRLYSGTELLDLLKEAGFSRVRIYGGLDGRDYNQDAKRLIAVAVK